MKLPSNSEVKFPDNFLMVRFAARTVGIVFVFCAPAAPDRLVLRTYSKTFEIYRITGEQTLKQWKVFTSC